MRRSALVLRSLLVVAIAVSGVALGPASVRRFGRWPELLERSTTTSLEERAIATLTGTRGGVATPGLYRAAALLEPAAVGAPPLGLVFAFVAHGSVEAPLLTARGGSLLMHHFSPHGWPVYLPLDHLLGLVARSERGRPAPGLPESLHGAEIFLLYDISETEAQALVALVEDKLGFDLLRRGRSVEGRHHVLLLAPLAERIAAGAPGTERLRALLP